jgi:outer membrane protein TolC
VHAPPGTITSRSAQLRLVPPTHATVPHATTRRSPPFVSVQTQSEWPALQPGAQQAQNAKPMTEELRRMRIHSANRTQRRAAGMLFACAFALAPPARAAGFRLEDAVRLALQNNERARKAPLRVEVADASLARARDAVFPTLTASGSGVYHPATRGPALSSSGALTLTQPLLNPSAFPQYAQQSHNREAEAWGSVEDKRSLAFDVAKAFIQALTAEGVLQSAQRKLDAAKLNLETSQARAQSGLASVNDVTKAELQLATSQGQIANTQGNVRRAYIALSFLVGQRVEGPLVPPDTTTQAAQRFEQARSNQVKTALERRERAVAAAEQRRPDVRSLHEKNAALAASASEPLYRLIPSVNAAGQLRFVPDPLASEKALDEQASINLSWQLFDAGVRYADRDQRRAQLESSRLDEKLLRRSVQNDIELALATLHAARENFTAAAAAATAAQKNGEETSVLYQQGLATAFEVSDANDKRFDAEVTRAAAQLQMEQAYLDLRAALGFEPLERGEPGAQAPTAERAP